MAAGTEVTSRRLCVNEKRDKTGDSYRPRSVDDARLYVRTREPVEETPSQPWPNRGDVHLALEFRVCVSHAPQRISFDHLAESVQEGFSGRVAARQPIRR